jgi:hypothetical protein
VSRPTVAFIARSFSITLELVQAVRKEIPKEGLVPGLSGPR